MVQDVYGTGYKVNASRYPEMKPNEKRIIKSKPLIEKTHNYYPAITFRSDGKVYFEFSASKILFDNNVEELEDSNKEAFIKTLDLKLFDMGLSVSKQDLWQSKVSFCTVSKNVIIDDIGATEFIEFTRRLWWKWRHSVKFENYQQNGVAFREFTSTTGIGIYAKVPSLNAITTMTNRELELANGLKENNILRFEYRMQTYQRTKSKYSWAKGYRLDEITLLDIFSSELSKKILLYDLNKSLFSDEFKFIPMQLPTIKKMYQYVMGKGLKPNEEWAIIAYFRLCSDLGVDTAHKIFKSRYSDSTTKRVRKLCNEVFSNFEAYEYSQIRTQIQNQLKSFKSISDIEVNSMLKPDIENNVQMKLI